MSILIRSHGSKKWEVVESAGYNKEGDLQELLSESPSLIPAEEIRPGTAPFLVAVREFGLPGSGNTDLLVFSGDGDVAVVECKLADNAEIKRRVIGQILEYGAYLWRMPYEEVSDRVLGRTGRTLAELMAEAVGDPNWDEQPFRERVEEILAEGSFMLIIAVDQVNEELAKTVDFLNGCGSPSFSFHALEMPRFRAKGTDVLVPHLYGTPIAESSRPTRKKWTEAIFLEAIADLPPAESAVVKDLYDWSRRQADWIGFGTGGQIGSFTFNYLVNGKRVSVFTVYTNGSLVLNYGAMGKAVEATVVNEFRLQIEAISSFRQMSVAQADSPSIKVGQALVEKQGAIDEFEQAVLALGKRIKE